MTLNAKDDKMSTPQEEFERYARKQGWVDDEGILDYDIEIEKADLAGFEAGQKGEQTKLWEALRNADKKRCGFAQNIINPTELNSKLIETYISHYENSIFSAIFSKLENIIYQTSSKGKIANIKINTDEYEALKLKYLSPKDAKT